MKRALIIRLGAYGDNIMISPAIQKLKDDGYYIIFNTNKRGKDVYKHDPRIDEFIMHQEDMPVSEVEDHWKKLQKEVQHDKFVNFTSSIENNVALHPTQPAYIYPKSERREICNKNYYDETMQWAGYSDITGQNPSLHFTEDEEKKVKKYIKSGRRNILWALSGSGRNKVYPWTEFVMGSVIKEYPNVNFITVGDYKCKLLENLSDQLPKENFTELAGEISFRESMLLTKYVDLVIAPDTGLLHASGCFDTPKIGLLGHTTKENITKYFKNDYSIEATCACSPCFYLIYDHAIQCPIERVTSAAWCMAEGIKPEVLFERIKEALNADKSK